MQKEPSLNMKLAEILEGLDGPLSSCCTAACRVPLNCGSKKEYQLLLDGLGSDPPRTKGPTSLGRRWTHELRAKRGDGGEPSHPTGEKTSVGVLEVGKK